MKAEVAGDDNGPPRVALVLGAAVWETGPSPTLQRRVDAALELWRKGNADRFILCGGLGRWPPSEAEVMAGLLRGAGVPADRILLEARSASTWENLLNALPLVQDLNTRRVWIVTDDYHMPRALLIARQLGLHAEPAAVRARWTTHRVRMALREVPALLLHLAATFTGRRRVQKG